MKTRTASLACAALSFLAAAGCRALPDESLPATSEVSDEIVVCGERFPTGAPVVLWFEPPSYSAYATEPRFTSDGPSGLRYRPGRATDDAALAARLARDGQELDALREVVDLFVLHYDACGTSRECFRVLQDQRQLSVHFLLDVDGTVYQTLDLREQAWHARQANPRSIGVEIAHIGAYPEPEGGRPDPLEAWYRTDRTGVRLTLPERLGGGGVRRASAELRPARPELVRGEINGVQCRQYDFTPQQYESLVRLTASLVRIFPRLRLDVPRDAQGHVRMDVLSDEDFGAFSGVLGHHHVSEAKIDPGPAFEWERFLEEVGQALAGGAETPTP